MGDYSELKRLADAANDTTQHYISHSIAAGRFASAANPAALLELIAENERLRIDAADVNWMVEQRDQMREENEKLQALARRTLWIAYCWNDHNFEAAHLQARKEAEAAGIHTFEEANAFLASLGVQIP